MKLVYLPPAIRDIDRLFSFLIDNKATLATADKAIDAIESGVGQLTQYPDLGSDMNDGTQRRELYIPSGKNNYVVRYFPDRESQEVLILRVWHSREDRE